MKESGLAFADVAFQLAPCGVELCLVIAEVHAVTVDLFKVTPDFLAIFSDLGVILVQLGPAIADFFARAAHVFKILVYLRFVMMAAIIVASVSMIEARIRMSVIATVVLVE